MDVKPWKQVEKYSGTFEGWPPFRKWRSMLDSREKDGYLKFFLGKNDFWFANKKSLNGEYLGKLR